MLKYRHLFSGRTIKLNPLVIDEVYCFTWDDTGEAVEWRDDDHEKGIKFDDCFEQVKA